MGNCRAVIDMETLEIYPSMTLCAKELGVRTNISTAISMGRKVKGRKLEYFDYWVGLDPRDKEKFSRKNGFYFY